MRTGSFVVGLALAPAERQAGRALGSCDLVVLGGRQDLPSQKTRGLRAQLCQNSKPCLRCKKGLILAGRAEAANMVF